MARILLFVFCFRNWTGQYDKIGQSQAKDWPVPYTRFLLANLEKSGLGLVGLHFHFHDDSITGKTISSVHIFLFRNNSQIKKVNFLRNRSVFNIH